jgi:hypothetical protein
MATVRAYWSGGKAFDLHLVAGSSTPPLDTTALALEQSPGSPVWASPKPADVASVVFSPAFQAQGAQPPGAHRGFGVTVNTSTGQVTVASPLPGGDRLFNFLLTATVTLTGGSVLDPAVLRVHVHGAMADAWLTPNPLTVYHGADDTRLSILARFDDGVVGDISELDGVTWSSGDATKLTVGPQSGALRCVVHPATLTVTVTLPAAWGGGARTAAVDTRPPRSASDVRPLAAGARRSDVPNILILSEGFQQSEREAFFDLASQLVHQVRTLQSTRPYDRLPINFWAAFVPSRDRGSSVLQAVKLQSSSGLLNRHFPEATAPSGGAATWSLSELIHEVGLPVPADSGATRAPSLTRWQNVYGAHVTGLKVPQAVFDAWKAIAGYRLADERDTAFGLRIGTRPNVSDPDDLRGITWHRFRATRAHLDVLLGTLRDGNGAPFGSTWQAGRDRPLVFMFCGGSLGVGMQTVPPDELIAAGLVPDRDARLAFPSGPPRAAVGPYPLPRRPSADTRATLVHEVSHAFGLLDEYGGTVSLPATPSVVADVSAAANVQVESTLLTAGALDGDKIKWRWPRIRAAGVLKSPPAPVGTNYTIALAKGHAAQFAVGQIVRLRARPLRANPVPSDRLEVTAVTPATDEVTVKLRPGSVLVPVGYPAGSILIEPRRAPAPSGTLGDDQELVAKVVRAHITTTNRPLNRTAAACVRDDAALQKALNTPAAATLRPGHPKFPGLIVGLWDGGASYHCGVYHPTGACLMRQLNIAATSVVNPNKMYRLCQVCRYVLVDEIDPTLHRLIDDDYDRDYPQP